MLSIKKMLKDVVHAKPHPDAVLKRQDHADVYEYPASGSGRDDADSVKLARARGYVVVVPVVRTADGSVRHINIEPQCGGLAAVDQVLRRTREARDGREVPVSVLKSEWDALTDKERDALLDKPIAPAMPVPQPAAAQPAVRSR